ncbi:MAG: DUF2169 domain-containing protein [Rhodospirillales bacterium]
MQITANTTGMPAEVCVSTDKAGRDYCVCVVKGTFNIDQRGETKLAEEQAPFVYADIHRGDPGTTSIQYECDFAPFKPRVDIIVNGQAMSPDDKPLTELLVGVKVGNLLQKIIKVVGDRRWENGFSGLRASAPKPFVSMPLVYERSFGGSDNSHPDPKQQGAELRNPVGAGYRKNSDAGAAEGLPLPNLEAPREPMRRWNDRLSPVGFGTVGRGWQPRVRYAGTYDERWLNERFPFLPEDFDERYFQSAPDDQQTDSPINGEIVRCVNLSPAGFLQFGVPRCEFPVTYRFRDRDEEAKPALDTLIIEPDQHRFFLVWRTRVPLGRKLNVLREILVGHPAPKPVSAPSSAKPRFRSISEFIAWKNTKGRG